MSVDAHAMLLTLLATMTIYQPVRAEPIRLEWADNLLRLQSAELPGGEIEIWYIEAYCRPDSHRTDWTKHTVIPHQTRLIRRENDGRELHLRCELSDGVTVDHQIAASDDTVDFQITAHNPTDRESQVHWAQPCIRVGRFTGTGADATNDAYAYIHKSFVFLDNELTRMPTRDWATKARYTPGQVWAGPGVPRNDVNPRPLNPNTPSNGLIGCFRADDRLLMAVAFHPYQELFQGVIRCLHSDFRIGGLKPNETKKIRGKLYLVENNVPQLLQRYYRDFPEHAKDQP